MNADTDHEPAHAARFWNKVNKDGPVSTYRPDLGPCWLWTAVLNHGYGQLYLNGRMEQAHRIAYKLLIGEIPPDKELDHLCRVRHCVNPHHLEPVTSRINLRRGYGASGTNYRKTHCSASHEFTSGNTYMWRGERHCKICRDNITQNRTRLPTPLPRTVELTCEWCGMGFTFTRGRGGGTPTTCSPNCKLEKQRKSSRECAARKRKGAVLEPRTATCDTCGKPFTYRPKTGKQPTTCSDTCRQEKQRQYMRHYTQRQRNGVDH